MRRHLSLLLSLLASLPVAHAQVSATPNPPAPAAATPPDVLIFANGDRLTGKLQSVTAGNVVFASDMAGTLTLSIDRVKELRSGAEFALIRKGEHPGKTQVPQGSVEVAAGTLTLTPPAGQPTTVPATVPTTVPTTDVSYLIDVASFDKQINHQAGFLSGWNGTLTAGASIERSTTSATTFNADLALVRAIPTVPWMLPRNRTSIDISESYGNLSTPVIPPTAPPSPPSVVINSIFHADAERDQYRSPRLYLLADTSFDHNYGQGLQLQQVYGAGVGFTALKSALQELDLKVDAHYEKQQYISTAVNGTTTTTPAVNLIGTTVFEAYSRDLPRKLIFTETASILPAWNNFSAYSANMTASLAMPVFKRLSATITTTDSFLNDPAQYYKKNSFQFITGVTYLLR